jgi:excinuclease ABC subunit A
LVGVGLGYLSLNSPAKTLSGGEAQRIRLATQIGSKLVNVLYILDEPSIGLHQRDNEKLIQSLKDLRDLGNSVLVVEHDKDMMLASDWLVEIGPYAGKKGGQIIASGIVSDFLKSDTTTAKYLAGKEQIAVPSIRRKWSDSIKLKGCRGHNLKGTDLLGIFTTSPTASLDVNGTARIRTINNATGDFLTTNADGVIQKRTSLQSITDMSSTISGVSV